MAVTQGKKGSYREVLEQWPLLLSVIIVLLFVHGVPLFSMPFIFREVTQHTDWSREQVTLFSTLQFGTGVIVTLVFGPVMDAIGDRRAILLAMVVNALSISCFLVADSLPVYYAVAVGMGAGGSAVFLGVKTFLSRRFEHNQGAALGLALTGTTFAGVVIPAAITLMLSEFPWQMAIAVMSLGTWFIGLPLFWWVTRGLPPVEATSAYAKGERGARLRVLKDLARKRDFWFVAIGIFLVGMVDMGIGQHQVLYLQNDRGLSAGLVAAVASGFAIIGIFSKIIFGALYDRFSVWAVAAAYLLLFIDPLLALAVAGPVTATLFVITRGAAHGALIVDVPILSKQVFGNRDLGLTIGIFSSVLHLGFATGPWVMGRVHTVTGSYVAGFLGFSAAALVAAILVSRVRPTHWLESRASAAPAAGALAP